jgi:hypothetical protein
VPYSITEVFPTSGGTGYANGYIVIQGGEAIHNGNTSSANTDSKANSGYQTSNANVQIIVDSTGAIIRTIINNVGLYGRPDRINLNGAVESIAVNTGARAVNSWITFSAPKSFGNTQATVNVANARIYVNTQGYILNVSVLANGIYYATPTVASLTYYQNTASVPAGISNAAYTITMGPSIIYAGNGVSQNGSGARFTVSYNANTTNVANIAATMTSNTLYTATIALTANSNSVTNATFTVSPVSNVETVANITVGFTGQNTPANVSVEVYPANGAIRKLTINTQGNYYYPPDVMPNSSGIITSITANSGAVGVNSFVIFTGGGTSNVAANAQIYVNTAGYIVNVVIISNGSYTSSQFSDGIPTARPNTGNGVLTVTRSGVGAYFRVNSKGIFTQTANNQELIIYK